MMTKDTSNITDEYVTDLMNRLINDSIKIRPLKDELLEEVLDLTYEMEEFLDELRNFDNVGNK